MAKTIQVYSGEGGPKGRDSAPVLLADTREFVVRNVERDLHEIGPGIAAARRDGGRAGGPLARRADEIVRLIDEGLGIEARP